MMQSNFNKKNTLKSSLHMRAKAKRRLIGSIVLLLLALWVLFKVSSNIKSIPINSNIIEVRNTNPTPVPAVQPTPQPTTTTIIKPKTEIAGNNPSNVDNKPQSSSTEVTNLNKIASNTVASNPVVSKTQNKTPDMMMTLKDLKPRITTDEIRSNPSPEDILNGNTENNVNKIYYLQLIGLQDKKQILNLQNLLTQHGYNTSIQTIITPTTKVYRLRMGPYNNQNEANNYLNKIKNVMQQ